MFTGRSYEEVRAAGIKSGQFKLKSGTHHAGYILTELGYFWENHGNRQGDPNGRPFQSWYLGFYQGVLSPQVYRKFLWGRPALLSIVSLNHPPHGRHLVYYDGTRIYDPQEGRRGKKFATSLDQVEIEDAHVWQH
jgi:hypothetical protein